MVFHQSRGNMAMLLAPLIVQPFAAPPSVDSSCNLPVANEDCFAERGLTEAECCSEAATNPHDYCWDWLYTAKRCCADPAPLKSSCGGSDWAFLGEMQRFYEVGELPESLEVPSSPEPLRELLRPRPDDHLDKQVERCAPATLARLAIMAEFTAALGTTTALAIARNTQLVLIVLTGMARAKGWLTRSAHKYPTAVVAQANERLDIVLKLHFTPRNATSMFLEHLGYGGTSRTGADCFAASGQGHRCVSRFRHFRPMRTLLRVLLAGPHARSVIRRAPPIGIEAVVLARMYAAVEFTGLRDADASRLLSAAALDLIAGVSEKRPVYQLLLTGVRAIATSINNKTEGTYAENHKEEHIVRALGLAGVRTRTFVEIGVGWGAVECNTRYLRQHHGWKGFMLDQFEGNEAIGLYQRMVLEDNINQIFAELRVPPDIDLLSIDVDGNDFWLWSVLSDHYRPRLVIIEYQHGFGEEDIVTRYSANGGMGFASEDGTQIGLLGSSLRALVALARKKGYVLAAKTREDAFFIRADIGAPEISLYDPGWFRSFSAGIVQKLLRDASDFYLTSAEALATGVPAAVDPAWTEPCLEEAFKTLCADPVTGQLCYSKGKVAAPKKNDDS